VTTTEVDGGGETITNSIKVPSTKIAAGVSVNFTKNIAMDMMLLASGYAFTLDKFSMLFSAKF
jgi:hypothetical protein